MTSTIQRPFTATMLRQSLQNAAKTTPGNPDDRQLFIYLNETPFPLTADNFRITKESDLVLHSPESWDVERNARRALVANSTRLRMRQILDLASIFAQEEFGETFSHNDFDMLAVAVLDKKQHASLETLSDLCRAYRGATTDETTDESGAAPMNQPCNGLAVRFSSPIRYYDSVSHYEWCWSSQHSCWIYAQSLEQAWKAGLEWQHTMAQHDFSNAFPNIG